MASGGSNFTAINPSTLTPLFTVQAIACAYPISDLYASSPRYLYYALLVATFATQWYPWLANVFLGAAATYAGTAAIEALILISNPSRSAPSETITIPYISGSALKGNQTLSNLPNLITDQAVIPVQPVALELDVDGILAIVVTGYLLMLPIHCWSPVIKAHRIRHLLMGLWNLLMLAGTICGLILWHRLYETPIQFRFCYPQYPDADSVTSDSSQLPDGVWQGNWNSTIWNTFRSFETAFTLADSCLYPCFNTSQIMRRPNTLVSSVSSANRSPRTNIWITARSENRIVVLFNLMYLAIGVSGATAIILLIITSTKLQRFTRVPVHRPKELLQHGRTELGRALWTEMKLAMRQVARCICQPRAMLEKARIASRRTIWRRIWETARWFIDIIALSLLAIAMVVISGTIVVFIVWIEWYIHRDVNSSELPSQVGQWTSSVSIALVLVSAIILRLKYRVASRDEIEQEIGDLREQLEILERLMVKKRDHIREKDLQRNVKRKRRQSQRQGRLSDAEAGKMDMQLARIRRANNDAG